MKQKVPMRRRSESSSAAASSVVLTIGHSTHPLDEFIRLLKTHGVTWLADVRTIPRSRRNPQYNTESLPQELKRVGVGYTHFPGLGGLRRPVPRSPNGGWRNASFRGFADYMQTPEFSRSLEQLLELIGHERVALMCAEAVPWRCHRSLVADALLVRGFRPEHIVGPKNRQVHKLTPFARVEGLQITYPLEEPPPI